MPLSNIILKTKFFLPRPPSDFIERKESFLKFDKLKSHPLMIVSAPTGYGKSTLIASFLLGLDDQYAWLSLSEKDNDLLLFIKYFVSALRGEIDGFGEDIIELLDAREPPHFEYLTELLINHLADLSDHLYFVLDDYQFIRNSDIHKLISSLFDYPIPYFHFIICTRRDPELPLPKWRNKNLLIEIRSSDLKFNRSEMLDFFNKAIHYNPDEEALKKLERLTDGWISGMRMLTLSTTNSVELQQHPLHFKYENSHVIHQLIEAILKNQTETTRNKLLKLSLLKEFNVDLFAAICLNEEEIENKEEIFYEFISTITRSNLFIIALDEKHNWYRFHHLFIEQLQQTLCSQLDADEINKLRIKAAHYFAQNQLEEEAIEFLLSANNIEKAILVFIGYRLKLIVNARFHQLEHMLSLFPETLIEQKAILYLTKAWIYLAKGNIPKMAELLEPIERLVEKEKHQQQDKDLFLGEVYALKTYDLYLAHIDLSACVENAKKAIKLLKDKNPYALGVAWIFYGASMQILKNTSEAKLELQDELNKSSDASFSAQILLILCYIDWFEGDLNNLLKTANHLVILGEDSKHNMAIAHGKGFLGLAHFLLFNNDEALIHLEEAFKLRFHSILQLSIPMSAALITLHAEKGNFDEKEKILQIAETTAFNHGYKRLNKVIAAVAADLNWSKSKDASALKWAKENDYTDYLPLVDLYNSELTQAKILVLDKSPASIELALKILDQMIPFLEDRNNTHFLIRSYTLKSLALWKSGKDKEGCGFLNKALKLTASRKFLRPFLELGTEIKELLNVFKESSDYKEHIDEILQLLPGKGISIEQKMLMSMREKEILSLAENHTNKEVGNQLFISEMTVKRHLSNIYKKLQVNSKTEALMKAQESNLL